jgi:ADP-dependent NAD(P)H-hydrate dehydratase / NAD(P)H-hydrate epimerase
MKRLLTAAQMRAVDAASAEFGMPASVLMENAGSALAEEALRLASPTGRFLVLCGRGNNGGDGLVAARILVGRGRLVHVEVVGGMDRLGGEPRRNLLALLAAGVGPTAIPEDLHIGTGDVVIDAIFGTGLDRPPTGPYAEAIRRIALWKTCGAKVLAADLPSGLEGDTGRAFDPCVDADVSLAFGFLKIGQVVEPGRSRAGVSREIDIGIPPAAHGALKGPLAWCVEEADARERIPVRSSDTHKGTYGHLLVIAGSRGKTGAAALAGSGALRAGAGLVTVATRPEAMGSVLAHAPELMGAELPAQGELALSDLNPILEAAEGKSALVIGPGIARGADTARLIGALVEELRVPCVLDADALNAVAEQSDVLRNAKAPLVFTPHPGEMARLLGTDTRAVQESRIAAVRRAAEIFRAVVVLKGAATLIAVPDSSVFVNPTGNPGMATGGTGDVLSGILGGLLAQRLAPLDAAIAGVYAHGLAGDLAAERTGHQGLVATDLLDGLCEVWSRWRR